MKRIYLILCFLGISTTVIAEPDCKKIKEVCVAPNQTRQINGLAVFRECWEYETSYECRSHKTVNDCQALRDMGCAQIGTTCIDRASDGSCTLAEQRYDCPDKPASTTEQTVCDESTFCLDGNAGCFDTSSDPDRDFGIAAVMMEASREAGVYGIDPNKVEIFKGYMESCSIKVLGGSKIKSCCGPSGGGAAFSNYKMMGGGVVVEAGGAVGKELISTGSKYVFDSLYANIDNQIVKQGLAALGAGSAATNAGQTAVNAAVDAAGQAATSTATNAAGTAATTGSTFGAYGFEFSYSFANGFQYVGFDPASLALQIGVMMVQKWLACDQKEQNMSMKKGLNLCSHVESYCHTKVLGVCVEKRERHCCFNSKLAKLINRQGRAQLGLAMNVCDGFTQDQIQAIDFTKIDFSEFIADILPKDIDANDLVDKANQRVNQYQENIQDIVKGYYD